MIALFDQDSQRTNHTNDNSLASSSKAISELLTDFDRDTSSLTRLKDDDNVANPEKFRAILDKKTIEITRLLEKTTSGIEISFGGKKRYLKKM